MSLVTREPRPSYASPLRTRERRRGWRANTLTRSLKPSACGLTVLVHTREGDFLDLAITLSIHSTLLLATTLKVNVAQINILELSFDWAYCIHNHAHAHTCCKYAYTHAPNINIHRGTSTQMVSLPIHVRAHLPLLNIFQFTPMEKARWKVLIFRPSSRRGLRTRTRRIW